MCFNCSAIQRKDILLILIKTCRNAGLEADLAYG
jgi:hypothetical protein